MIPRVCIVLVLALLWVPVTVNAQVEASARITAPGIHQLTLPGAGRRYTLAIPDGYTGQEPVPLIVSLHYGGTVTPFYGRGLVDALIGPAFRDLGAIIVAPDSAAGNWANATSEQHVLELLDHIEANYNIDADKTLLTGYSMGGGGTWYFAPRYPERFRAAIVMAGRPQDDSTSFDWETPMYVIHSRADQVVPFESTEATLDQLQRQGVPIVLVGVDGIGHYEIPRYRTYLEAAVPWIKEAWAR
ncbi:MAG: prolyl oligopeptidase family serine peptidase [Gammaproteobacteria bacterium]|nr:prolyl oligopeptidase family serine peptidase [Gammaproteobacteria bacterium]